MNLKVSYHYTNFIYPFVVNHGKYKEFISKFLYDEENWEFYIRKNTSDLDTTTYFLPYVKKFIFPTLYWKNEFFDVFNNMSKKKQLDVISKLSCVNFKYKLKQNKDFDKMYNDSNINCTISNIELIAFETGIGFLIINAQLDSNENLCSDNILDFNYKFRTINPKYLKKIKSEGMTLKNSDFSSAEDLSGFIAKLLYGFEDVKRENIYFDRLFTYSYMCIDKSEWNENKSLDNIIDEFYKFQYVLPSHYGSTFEPEFKGIKDNTYSRWKYSIYGLSREAGVVFASDNENFNIDRLPNYYEKTYFYILIIAFYQRVSLILFSEELMMEGKKDIEKLKRELTEFTHFSWFSQICNSEQGMDIWKKWQKVFDLQMLFDEVQKEYEEFYNYTVASGQERINNLLMLIYIVSIVISGMQLMIDFKNIDIHNQIFRMLTIIIILITVFIYPVYILLKKLVYFISFKKKKY